MLGVLMNKIALIYLVTPSKFLLHVIYYVRQ